MRVTELIPRQPDAILRTSFDKGVSAESPAVDNMPKRPELTSLTTEDALVTCTCAAFISSQKCWKARVSG
jgi:hypothetical protein